MKEQYESFLRHAGADFKEHQFEGVSWLIEHEKNTDPLLFVKGGFLCDEMGVGKTIQIIATTLLHLLPRTLIIVPPPLLQQWKKEFIRFTGHTPLIYHGITKKKCSLDILSKAPIVITTYHNLLSSKKNIVSLLHSLSWSRIVFDEAHHLRNETATLFAAQRISKLSPIVWLVTGTPIQNRIKDLQNLCTVLGIQLVKGTDPRQQISHIILKRTKEQAIIQLPPITYHSIAIDWNNENERQLSEKVHTLLKYAPPTKKLLYYTMSKQVCVMPRLVESSNHLEIEQDISFASTTKLDSVLKSILSQEKGSLVFCHFHKEMQWLYEKLTQAGRSVAQINGTLSLSQRNTILESSYQILLLQIQVGCEGLNLQKYYSDIYFVSPHWNPAVESQAIARCYRYGQSSPVQVFRFYMNTLTCSPSMDTYTSDLQKRKLSLFV